MENQLRLFQRDFLSYLEAQNYSLESVKNNGSIIGQFLDFVSPLEVSHPREINVKMVRSYFKELKTRSNRVRGGALSAGTINRHISAVKLFQRFLHLKYQVYLPVSQRKMRNDFTPPDVLTKEEIRSLYSQCEGTEPSDALNRAMLSLYYGCGLRKVEGINLLYSDVDLDNRVIHIRNTKNKKDRLVPMPVWVMHHLKDYVIKYRPKLNKFHRKEFLVNTRGNSFSKDRVYDRFKILLSQSTLDSIRQKDVGLHTLRRSYATHLLEAGIAIESISKLLGHTTIETTKIYLIINDYELEKQTSYEYR